MHILFITENFPPERNAAASRVYERACYWIKWGHEVTVITCAPNFPEGKVYTGYKNRWYQVEQMDGIRVVRVKTFISANEGILLRTVDFVSFMFTSIVAGLFQKKTGHSHDDFSTVFCGCRRMGDFFFQEKTIYL